MAIPLNGTRIISGVSSIHTGLTVSAFNAVRFIVLEVTLGLFIPLLGRLYVQQSANTQILKGKGWTPSTGRQISWRLNLTTYSALILSMIALGIGLALEYGSGEIEVKVEEKRSTDVWSTMLNRSTLPHVILPARTDAEYGIYTSLASKFTRLLRENDTTGLGKKYVIHISPFYTTGLSHRMYWDDPGRSVEDPFVEFEAYSRNKTEICVSFEERDRDSSPLKDGIIMLQKDGTNLADHDTSENYAVRKDNAIATCNVDFSVPLGATIDSADVTCLHDGNDHITLIRGTMKADQWSNFTNGFPSRLIVNTNVYKIQAPEQRSKTIDRIILFHYRDNSASNKGAKGLTDGGGLHVMRSIALLLQVGSFANETIEETVKVGSEIYASIEVWALNLWVISTFFAIFFSACIWLLVRRSELKVNVTRTDGMFLIADDMVSKTGDCNNPKRKTSNKVVLVDKGSSLHLTIADPELAVVYTDQKITGEEI